MPHIIQHGKELYTMADGLFPTRQNTVPEGMMGEIQSEVPLEAAPLLQFIVRHSGLILATVLVLVLAIVATGGYQWYRSSNAQSARLELGRILTSVGGADRVKALEALAATAPDSMREGVQLELALAALAVGDQDKAAAVFGQVSAEDTGPLGIMSALNQADVLLRAGKADAALTVLEAVEPRAPESLRLMVRESLAGAAETAGKPERAIKAYEALIAAVAAAPAAGQVQELAYYRARVLALQGTLTGK